MVDKGVRVTFFPGELKQIYGLLGGEVARLTDSNAINDGRPSEISKQVADLKGTQDRIAEALRRAEEKGSADGSGS